jgi:hypothetical protein
MRARITVVHGLELTAVDGDARLRQQAHLSAKLNEARAYLADRGPVVLAEIGNGFVIGNRPPQQLHHFEIATRLALEPSARLHAIEIPVDVEFQKGRRVIGRSSRGCRLNPIEAQFSQIDSSHEGVDHANRIALSDQIIEALGQQRPLPAICLRNEALHRSPRRIISRIIAGAAFSHTLGQLRSPTYQH